MQAEMPGEAGWYCQTEAPDAFTLAAAVAAEQQQQQQQQQQQPRQ
jgi:hypothetical protein